MNKAGHCPVFFAINIIRVAGIARERARITSPIVSDFSRVTR